MIVFALGVTVPVFRPTWTPDRYGDPRPVYPDAPSHLVGPCAVAPVSSTEDPVARDAIVDTVDLYAPAGADLTATDQVGIDGQRWEIDGDPAVWTNPFDGVTYGVTARLRRVAG